MSNQNVGSVYQQVMKDVIEASRVDFEEGGVEESVLEELKMGWQKKLSELQIAQFPWDPKPEPPAAPVNQAMQQNLNYQPQDMNTPPSGMAQPNINLPNMALPQMPQMNNGPRIKNEPGLEPQGVNPPPQPFNHPPAQAPPGSTPQQRAAFMLQQNYGNRAAGSINALQSAMPQQPIKMENNGQMQQGQPQQQQRPPGQQQQQQSQMTPAQYNQIMASRMQAQNSAQNANNSNGVTKAQTDGAGDDTETVGILNAINSNGEFVEMGRVEIDNMIRKKIEANGRAMEGGGLMLPLKQYIKAGPSRQRKVAKNGESSASTIPQVDGTDSDDANGEIDEDAINSDLDDPEDGLNDDEDDDDIANVMLCMYDKVQRVKNKWKCVMKDGVITISGKEYVFHKASGEYEW